MPIRRVGVVGAGTMGQGIIQVIAEAGIAVIFQEVNQEAIDRALAGISAALDVEVAKWGITEKEKSTIFSRIGTTTAYEKFNEVDLVIEAVDEDLDKKKAIYDILSKICRSDVIFATNTSTLSVSNLGFYSGRPEQFIGLHFQPPVPKKPLVEIVRGLSTSNQTYQAVREFAIALHKTAIEVFEWPGYVTTRVMVPMINEAVFALMEGVASAEDIDKAMVLGCGMEMGPLRLADAMGLDTVVFQMEHLFHELGDIKYRPCPLLKKMIRAGRLGVKTGKGFFEYERPESVIVHPNPASVM